MLMRWLTQKSQAKCADNIRRSLPVLVSAVQRGDTTMVGILTKCVVRNIQCRVLPGTEVVGLLQPWIDNVPFAAIPLFSLLQSVTELTYGPEIFQATND